MGGAYHSVDAPSVARLDQQFHVRIHEWRGHGNRGSVGQNKVRILAETLDDAENVVPSATVQARAVVAEFVNNLQFLLAYRHLSCVEYNLPHPFRMRP